MVKKETALAFYCCVYNYKMNYKGLGSIRPVLALAYQTLQLLNVVLFPSQLSNVYTLVDFQNFATAPVKLIKVGISSNMS